MKSNFIHKVALFSLIINILSVLMINGYYKYYHNPAEAKDHAFLDNDHLEFNNVSMTKTPIAEMEKEVRTLYLAWVEASNRLTEVKFQKYQDDPNHLYLQLLQGSELIDESSFKERIAGMISEAYVDDHIRYQKFYFYLPDVPDSYLKSIIDIYFSGFLIRAKQALDEDEFKKTLECARLIAGYQKTNYKAAIPYLSCFMKKMHDAIKQREIQNNLDQSAASKMWWIGLDDCLKEYFENYSLSYNAILGGAFPKSTISYDNAKSYFSRIIE